MKYKITDLSTIIFYSAQCLEFIQQKQSLENIDKWLPLDILEKKSTITSYVKQSIRDYGYSSYILTKYLQNKKIHIKIESILRISISLMLANNSTKNAIKSHTLINQAVSSCKMHKTSYYASGLVNSILRKVAENIDEYKKLNLSFLSKWWQDKLKIEKNINIKDYYEYISKPAIMGLRVNAQKITTTNYLNLLTEKNIHAQAINLFGKYSPYAILLNQQINIENLPNFKDGYVSVQDIAAQICPQVIPLKDGMRILDACSAPGGKILSCLEQYKLDITVIDINNLRLEKVKQNIKRLNIDNQIINYTEYAADASSLEWWNREEFDVVIADVPCSASGIVRKQPEISLLRTEEDIAYLQQTQEQILNNLWHVVKKSGILLYINCSIFYDEGMGQINNFLLKNKNASLIIIDNISQFSVSATNDGFFYALLQKNS